MSNYHLTGNEDSRWTSQLRSLPSWHWKKPTPLWCLTDSPDWGFPLVELYKSSLLNRHCEILSGITWKLRAFTPLLPYTHPNSKLLPWILLANSDCCIHMNSAIQLHGLLKRRPGGHAGCPILGLRASWDSGGAQRGMSRPLNHWRTSPVPHSPSPISDSRSECANIFIQQIFFLLFLLVIFSIYLREK